MKNRNQIEEKYKWNLDEYCPADEWDTRYQKCVSRIDEITKFDGKLTTKANILKCFQTLESISREFECLITYAHLRRYEDVSNPQAEEKCGMISSKATEFEEKSSFVTPQLTQLTDEFLINLSKDKKLKDYNKLLLDIVRERPHILNEREEKLMSGVGGFAGDYRKTFSGFEDGDLKFNQVENGQGKKLPFDAIKYYEYSSSPDRVLRKNTYIEMNGAFGRYSNFITSNYLASVKKDVFFAKARNFNNALEKALFYEEVDEQVYKTLVDCIHKGLPIMQRYFAIKGKILGVKKFGIYDTHAKIGKAISHKFTYEQAMDIIRDATKYFGQEYTDTLSQAQQQRWIDVMPNKNKNSGAFSWGAYGHKPVLMLNFDGTYNSVSTLAHELGHSMHSYFSDKNNPYFKAGYTIFCAEVASTVNEILLVEYMLSHEKSKATRAYYLEDLLSSINSTIFRQTMFSEFEDFVHKSAEQSKPLSSKVLNEYYFKLNKEYFGNKVDIVEEIKYEWSRIPHFYNAYYVYKYATGMISAITIVKRILDGEKDAVSNYFKFLSGGCSDTPTELLKKGGVDLTNQSTYNNFIEYLDSLVDRLQECK